MYTQLHITETASAFGRGKFVGRLQIDTREVADHVAELLRERGYAVVLVVDQPAITDWRPDERRAIRDITDQMTTLDINDLWSID